MRRWVFAVAAGLVVVGIGGAVYLLRFRSDDTTTAVGVSEAVDRYRSEVTEQAAASTEPPSSTPFAGSSAPTAMLPAPGVYTYATSGGDAVDALGGASHDYPAMSTITVTASGCRTRQVWTPAEERSDEFVTCPSGSGVELRSFTAFHRFFGQDQTERDTCVGDPRPLGARAGTTWTTRCVRADEVSDWAGTVVGTETMSVGGRAVSVEHVVVTIDNGDARDQQRTESWYLQGTDLVVRRVVNNATTEGSPIGDVHYTEHYEIVLDDLTPAG